MRNIDIFLWSRLRQVDGVRRGSRNAPFAYSWTHRFITLYKHGTVPENKHANVCVFVCMQISLVCCSSTHGQFPEHWKTDLTSRMSSLLVLTKVESKRRKTRWPFHSSPVHTHTLSQILPHSVGCAHYRSNVPLAPDSTQPTQRTLTCIPAIASLTAKCPQSFGQGCVNGYIYMPSYTVIKAVLQLSWSS